MAISFPGMEIPTCKRPLFTRGADGKVKSLPKMVQNYPTLAVENYLTMR
ncbi:MAG TPA: hypothetical protein VFV38_38605 [Ktedonobacteraceae bacterium]|nr:hypothetical protein [Ktedonobacteraceae bacterium]